MNKGGYAQWKCRRCEVVFTTGNKMKGFSIYDRNCTSDLALFDDESNWHYRMIHATHQCNDNGVGIADFQGLNPVKIK